jgi:hypothetical protein
MAEHYKINTGVILSAEVKRKVKKIADQYHTLTGKDVVVTSGMRTSQKQAEAMYGKLAGGDQLKVYKNQKAAKEVADTYSAAKASGKNKSQIIKAMTAVIDNQIRNQIYLSKHLAKGAVDIRSRDMTTNDKAHFKKAATGIASTIILERTPPHFHLGL